MHFIIFLLFSEGAILNDFSGESIRLIIFKDQYGDICDDRIHDRRVIFDSKCVSIEHVRIMNFLIFTNENTILEAKLLYIYCLSEMYLYTARTFYELFIKIYYFA